MTTTTTIAVDAMGGDFGPSVTVPAAVSLVKKFPNLRLILVGRSDVLEQNLETCPAKYRSRIEVRHASEVVAMDELPSRALRGKKDSSMRVAINLVKNGLAQACVSAGNTGALMATARYVLKTLPGVDRPAIIHSMPTVYPEKGAYFLDLGANVDSQAEHLYQFAVMGSTMVAAVENIAHPKVGLLNIGSEEIKGNEQVKEAAHLLAASHERGEINYIGYVEGDDIFKGEVDVVVCDGFIGNVALKTIEGMAKLIATYVKRGFTRNIYNRLVAVAAYPVLRHLKRQLDPGRRNGASLIGLQGIVIKSHGGANEAAFAHAILEALLEVEKNVPQRIRDEVGKLLQKPKVGRAVPPVFGEEMT